ncbi:MAG: hypothetical protein CM15mP121_0120 [Bacteroidota bacterium]|nr:MAG: hypothetical protein CM15mP121_0120 [Bacteroidota bacterium]
MAVGPTFSNSRTNIRCDWAAIVISVYPILPYALAFAQVR